MTVEEQKQIYKNKIDEIAKSSFNNEQKAIAKEIIDNASAKSLDKIYQLIIQRVRTGFVFDAAPEINHNAISIIEHNPNLSINLENSITPHTHTHTV
ncbi:hypothetical protein CJJ23_01100 [Mycoplasmopsis agassizii]|uniref:Uncharacterized protein n=1 Tax=Mycoplasmopsis agassizii TaxID=33922 RepID=A0A269TJ66_9BACT|nr:hypothetical protein [Mycoplasmopsis agassizii]PAK21533.1 hypothetical protein CJJ23_01100 [Mycoplasmopsis agassizii]